MNLLDSYRSDSRWWVVCKTCKKRHEFAPVNDAHRAQQYEDFATRHEGHKGVLLYGPEDIERLARRVEKRRKARDLSVLNYAHNANVLIAYQGSDQALDLTSFNSLASSATAGWSSAWIDNTVNLYLDYIPYMLLAAVNTAPGNNKAIYVYTTGNINTTDLPSTGGATTATVANSGTTAAALTFPDITANPQTLALLTTVPYVATNVAVTCPMFGIARAFGGSLYRFTWLAVVNFSGFTFAASGNKLNYRGVFLTVA